MKSLEIQNKINVELGYYLDINNLNIPSTNIQHFANKAIDEVFDEYYDQFQKNEVTNFEIGSLIKKLDIDETGKSSDQSDSHSDGIILDLPAGFHYTLKEYLISGTTTYKVKPIDYDYYEANINNPRKNPDSKNCWRLDLSDNDNSTSNLRREIIHNGSVDDTSFNYHVHYIKRPEKVNFKTNSNVDLGDKPMRESISRAVQLIYNFYSPKNNENGNN